ncbi:unnamed protein product [Caenorhabditis angaria]|uniref:DUF19 domain-containing protein n=1 Tax=Caenorhabditis angaria TaxID=860376 RepID=A0A9P1J0J2_9PELO|nr:unnamed protein product [Caenorhabditis angaria]
MKVLIIFLFFYFSSAVDKEETVSDECLEMLKNENENTTIDFNSIFERKKCSQALDKEIGSMLDDAQQEKEPGNIFEELDLPRGHSYCRSFLYSYYKGIPHKYSNKYRKTCIYRLQNYHKRKMERIHTKIEHSGMHELLDYPFK